ncbi:uncharacterized protein TNCV_222982 [Trichonephila clavipes]|nr:uncharacterized protein TNCV_222982 [Trichonephila clavipes]
MGKVSDHARHVMSSSPVPLKTRRVGQRCTLNLTRAQTSSSWCGVVVRRGGSSSLSSTSLDYGSKLHGPSPKALLRACGLLVAGSNSGVTEDPPYRGADARYIYRDSKFSRSCGVEIYRDGCLTVGRLVVRASDSRPEGLGSMPPNTLRVHTEYVLVKSVGLKSCGLSNERRGLDNISLSFSSITEIVEVKVGGVAIYRPFGLNRTVTCMVLKANNRRTSSPLPR